MMAATAAMPSAAVSTEESFQHAHVLLPFLLMKDCGNVAGGDGFPQGLTQVESLKQLQGQARAVDSPWGVRLTAQAPPGALPSGGR
ncbi:hypothetical protein SAMN03159363_4180 [Variovorax sp. EL159]|nr:hypothetical protein SAMN03159363_4180 [Variovorax sp. EL159]